MTLIKLVTKNRPLKVLDFGIFLIFLWLVLSITWIPSKFVATTPYPVTTDPSDRGLNFQSISIEGDEITLAGWWIPAKDPIAELIFVHGWGSNRASEYLGSLDFYRTLHDIEVSVITMDLRNHGNSSVTDSILHGGSSEWHDVLSASKWLDNNQAEALPRFIFGASMGASVVIQALKRGLNASGVILLDPQLDMVDSLMQGGRVNTGLPAPFFVIAAFVATWKYDLPIGPESPMALASKLHLPILIIQDWDDPVTSSRFSQTLADRNTNVDLKRVPAIEPDDPCVENKGAWGSHVAAHPCHPDWTREIIQQFIKSNVKQS